MAGSDKGKVRFDKTKINVGMEKGKALEMALAHIEKQFGKGAIMKLGEAAGKISVSAISTGCMELDYALGVGGVPRGRIIEIFGPESSGKTTVALHIVAVAQAAGGAAAFVDAEHALDPEYARNLGVNVAELYVSQPDTGEQALEIVEALVRSGALDVIVVDSVAALVPRAELEGDMGDAHMGLQARLMSQALRKLAGAISKTNCVVIFINQLRQKLAQGGYGTPETTTGGKALKFYASVRMDVRKIETLKSGAESVGNRTKVKIVKNKVAPPFKIAEFDIIYGEGISREGSLLDMAAEKKIVSKTGAWYSYGELRLGQGRDNTRVFLKDNAELRGQIEAELRQLMEQERAQAAAQHNREEITSVSDDAQDEEEFMEDDA